MNASDRAWTMLFCAFAIAAASSFAVLFIGEVMGQLPCNLCWFQRTSMFPLAIMLGLAALRSDTTIAAYGIAIALFGWAVAAFHTLLYVGIIPAAVQPCTATGPSCSSRDMTILGGLPLPMLALMAFSVIILLLILSHRSRRNEP